MCLGELGRVARVEAAAAEVRVGARTLRVSLLTLPEPVTPGDWVLVHSGYALARLTAQEAADASVLRGAVADAEEGSRP